MKIIIIFIFIINLIFNQTMEVEIYKTQLDSLLNHPQIKTINRQYTSTLGRNNDPKLITDISKSQLFIRKFGWTMLTIPGLGLLIDILYPKSTISHFNVDSAIAFTIDDGFCGIDNNNGCMVNEVRKLFKSYDAHATFFITGSHCNKTPLKDINLLINDGHEIANHNMMDWSYKNYTIDDFEFDLLLTEKILSYYNQEYSNWYRAPFGQLSNNMQMIINKYGMKHVLPDVFAHDTFIPNPKWISRYILKRVQPGSVILIHMPEKGVREWNYEAIKLTLIGLNEKNLKVLNLTEMSQIENKKAPRVN